MLLYDVTRIEPFIHLPEGGRCDCNAKLEFRCSHQCEHYTLGYSEQRIFMEMPCGLYRNFHSWSNCLKFNANCVMCVMRCPTFGPG